MENEKNVILESLISLGLKENEAKVYLACLKMGQATVTQIADTTDVQRTFIYDILEELQDKGLISQVEVGKVKHFSALSVDKFKKHQEEKLAKFQKVLPELKALEKSVGDRPHVQFFEGLDGIKMALEDTLKQPKGSKILAYATGEGAYEQMPEFLNKYLKERVRRRISVQALAPDNEVNREHVRHDKEVMRETILLPEKKFPFTNEIDIYGNKVAIMSLQGEILAVIIESESVAKTQRAIFELAWEGAEKYQNKPEIVETREKSYDKTMTQEILEQKIVEAVKASPYRDYIQSISLFGSYLHGGAGKDSDVDLLYVTRKPMTLFQIGGLNYYLAQKLGRKVDLVPKNSVIVQLRDKIIPEAKKIYETQRR